MENKFSVMFVDDDQNVINGLKRSLFAYRNKWNLYFVNGGAVAIESIKSNQIDLVFCDIMMPKIDGTEVLRFIDEKSPRTIRIVLSGHSDIQLIIKSTRYSHQYLSKPTTPDLVLAKINDAIYSTNYIRNPQLLPFVGLYKDSPFSSSIYTEIEKSITEDDVSSKKIASIVEKDPILSAKILQIANSGFFALSRRISMLSEAISYVGINTIKRLIIYFNSFNMNQNDENSSEIQSIANKSLHTAYELQEYSKALKFSGISNDDAFTIGLLHLIGKLILIKVSKYDSYQDHEQIGAYTLGIWGLPRNLTDAIMYQNNPTNIGNSDPKLASLLYIVSKLSTLNTLEIEHISTIIDKYDNERMFDFLFDKYGIDLNITDKSIVFRDVINLKKQKFSTAE